MDGILECDVIVLPNPKFVGRMQHLYFVSNRVINGKMISEGTALYIKERDAYYAIEATTDRSLGLPHIPFDFMEEYKKSDETIKKVPIEMETVTKYGNMIVAKSPHNNKSNSDMSIYFDIPRLKNNEVIIVKV